MNTVAPRLPLLDGFRRFQLKYFGDGQTVYEQLREGQKPATMVIGCCDSRVHPPMLFDAKPGELFTLRNVANLVPPHRPDNPHASVAAALEFGVLVLQVQHVVVLGHSGCGGIRALLQQQGQPGTALGQWLDLAAPVRRFVCTHHAGADAWQQQQLAEKAAILVSLDNLMTYPWLMERVRQGHLSLHGWHFNLHTGALKGYDPQLQCFAPLVPPLAPASPAAAVEEEISMVTANQYIAMPVEP